MPLTVILATAGYDHKIRYWDANSGACTRTTKFEESQVNALQISRNKYYLAVAGNPNIHLYDVNSTSDTPVISFEGHTNNVTAVGFQQDTQWLYSCSEDSTIRIWDLRAAEAQRTYECQGAVHTVALHPNQTSLISGDQTGAVKTWDILGGRQQRAEVQAEGAVRSLSVSPDGRVLTAAAHKGTLHVLQPGEDKEFAIRTSFEAHSEYILKTVLAQDMTSMCTSSADNTIKVWDPLNDWALVKTLKQHQRWVWDLAYSADASFVVSASSDTSARLWDLRSGSVIRNYLGHSHAVTCVALNDSPN